MEAVVKWATRVRDALTIGTLALIAIAAVRTIVTGTVSATTHLLWLFTAAIWISISFQANRRADRWFNAYMGELKRQADVILKRLKSPMN
jgi:hypothetical protein